ncbi:MAG: GTPase domain-containing protein [Acidimicrobiia bacterium]|nr:GTPase domain-containing protein [Acidimicrobiia bacterium]NNC41858.1 GTPase domain-containing protein [Acidimicrobiia bacterium]NNL28841.1 GTPase domain-containing protein [Acidimicrobiia bacterium]NNL49126.1 GTPase domain-containing protein [Acidimicrobiia bacterium]
MTITRSAETLRTSLEGLASVLEGFSFRVDPDRLDARRREMAHGIRTSLIPRLDDPDGPVTAVIIGQTGSGKSMLLNSLVGEMVSPPGAVRPVTRRPVILAHRKYATRYLDDVFSHFPDMTPDDLNASTDPLTAELTMIDTPDFELLSGGEQAAEEVLGIADLCIFVASALRYADAAAWNMLDHVKRRGLPVLFVLNRIVDNSDRDRVADDFARLLYERELLLEPDRRLIFEISEQDIDASCGCVAADVVEPIREELILVSERGLHNAVVRQSAEGAVADLIEQGAVMADAVDRFQAGLNRLRRQVNEMYETEATHGRGLIRAGRLVGSAMPGVGAIVEEVAAGLVRRASIAARSTARLWEADAIGGALLEYETTLWMSGEGAMNAARDHAETWIQELTDLVAERTSFSRRDRGALLFATVEAVLGGSNQYPAVLTRRLGGQALENLITERRRDLERRLGRVLDADSERFLRQLDRVNIDQRIAPSLRNQVGELSRSAGGYFQ